MYFSDQNPTPTHFLCFVFQVVFHRAHSHEHDAMFLIHRRQREQGYHQHVVKYRDCDKDKNPLNQLIVPQHVHFSVREVARLHSQTSSRGDD